MPLFCDYHHTENAFLFFSSDRIDTKEVVALPEQTFKRKTAPNKLPGAVLHVDQLCYSCDRILLW